MNYNFWYVALLLWKWQFFEQLSQKLIQYGWIGVFVVAFLDSAFVPMPSGPDLLLVYGLSYDHSTLRIVSYVLSATIGSTIGCTILYLFARRGGEVVLKAVSVERREYVQGLLGRYDAVAIVVASLMPPPFPFKPFILCAGVFKFKLLRLIVGLLIGRSLRYFILAMLALYFGEATIALLKVYGPQLLIVLIAAGALFFTIRYFKTRNSELTSDEHR